MWTMACTLIAVTTKSEQAWPSDNSQKDRVRNAWRAVKLTSVGLAGRAVAAAAEVEPGFEGAVSGGKPSMRWPTSSGRLRTMLASGQPRTMSTRPEQKAAIRQP